MVFGFNNMNMLNLNNMSCGNLFGSNTFSMGSMLGMPSMLSGSIFGMNNMFGYGQLSLGGFGNGCSLFTNCNGTTNFNAIAGFQVADALFNVGSMALGQYVSERKANSQKTLQGNANEIKKELDERLADYDAESVDDIKVDIKAAKDNVIKADKDLEAAEKIYENAIKSIAELETQIENLEKPDEDLENYEELKAKYDKNKKDLEDKKTKLEEQTAEDGEFYKAKIRAEEGVAEMEEALELEEQKAEDLKEIKALAKEYENAQKLVNDKVLEKASGKKWNRNDELNLDNFQVKGKDDFTEKDVHQLVFQFKNLKDGDPNKLKTAQALANLDSIAYLNVVKTNTNTMVKARDLAIEYVKKHPGEE